MILFAAGDAGPAAYLSRIIDALGEDFLCVSSVVSAQVFGKYGDKNRVLTACDQKGYDDYAEKAFFDTRVELVVTGTCWGDCLDKALIRFATGRGIKVISVIEHWSWYRERFEAQGRLRVPDFIVVNDEIARKGAIQAGLPARALYPLGNPVLEGQAAAPLPAGGKSVWRQSLGITAKKVVVFISECYRRDFPEGSSYYQGFDEFQVLEDILQLMPDGHQLIIKMHPQESPDKYDRYRKTGVSILPVTDSAALTAYADLVIGMGSMLLLEMAMCRRDVVSYRPCNLKGFIGNDIGATTLVRDKDELRQVLQGEKVISGQGLNKRFQGSTQRIVDFIKDKLV